MTQSHRMTLLFLVFCVASIAALLVPTSLGAEPIRDPEKLDAARIYCNRNNPSDESRQTCLDNYDGNNADETVCNSNYPHTPGSGSMAEEQFKACLDGWRNGDSNCIDRRLSGGVQGPITEAQQGELNDACLTGSAGQTETKGPASGSSGSSSGGSSSEPLLGPKPTTTSLQSVTAEKTEPIETSSCTLSGVIGDLICSGMSITGSMADASLYILGAFMKVPPLQTSPDNPIYAYWDAFRQIANILFIVAFLVVVYSYLTNSGLSNYSVKRIVPRLIAAALLVNTSFYVCSIAVDASNILGATVYSTVDNLIAAPEVDEDQAEANEASEVNDDLRTNLSLAPTSDNSLTTTTNEEGNRVNFTWMEVVALVTAAAASAYAFLSWGGIVTLLPILLSVVLAVAITVITLLLRQVLIILFIVISPLAFVAITLPNTKEYFDRWARTFIPVLMLYPVIALVFAAGTVASSILAYGVAGAGFPARIFYIIMAMGMQIVPLFLVPKIMQAGNGMLASFSGTANSKTANIRKKTRDFTNKKVQEGDKKAAARGGTGIRGARNRMRGNRAIRTARNETLKNTLAKAEEKAGLQGEIDRASAEDFSTAPIDSTATDSSESAPVDASHEMLATPDEQVVAARAKKVRAHGTAKKVDATIKQMEGANTPRDERMNMAKGSDEIESMAAIKDFVEQGDDGGAIEISKESDKLSSNSRGQFVQSVEDGRLSDHALFKDSEVKDNIRKGKVTASNYHRTVVAPALNNNDFSSKEISEMSPDTLIEIKKALTIEAALPQEDRTISNEKAQNFLNSAAGIQENAKLKNTVGRQYVQLNELEQIRRSGAFR